MRVLLFGASGMVGSGVLLACLRDPRVTSVLAVGRSPLGRAHLKLRELLHRDFLSYDTIRGQLTGHDACFFCLGVSSARMSETEYRRLTYQVAVALAEVLVAVSPDLTFCYVSGAGTDSTERGRIMWARVKGKTENRLLELFPRAYMFRPGFIQPVGGVRSKTRLYRVFYDLTGPFYPLLRRLFPSHVMTSDELGQAMISVAADGYGKRILEVRDINQLAARNRAVGEAG